MSEKISITLPEEMVAIIKSRVESGRYASTSEVLREAMRNWMRDEEEHSERLAAVRARIARALDDPRPSIPFDEAFARLETSAARIKASR